MGDGSARRAIGAHGSFFGENGDARVRDAFPESTYQRVAAVNRRYDPSNLVRLN